MRALGILKTEGGLDTFSKSFKDVDPSVIRNKSILLALDYGFVNGYPDATFRADQKITREEAMVILGRVLAITQINVKEKIRYQTFSDFYDVSNWGKASVKEVLSAYIFNGKSRSKITPKAFLTQAEAIQSIKNLLVEAGLINR